MSPFTFSCVLARSSSFLRASGTVRFPVRSRRFSPPFLLNMGRPRGQKILGERQARRQRRLVPSCCGPTRRWSGPAHERRVLHAGAGGRGPLSAGSLAAYGSLMPSKDDAPAGSSEVGEMARRFLRGDLTLEDAALGIAEHVPRDGVWGLL